MRLKDFKQWEAVDLVRSLEEGVNKTSGSHSTHYAQQIVSVREAVEQELSSKDLTFLDKASERAQSILSITDIGNDMQRVRSSMKWIEFALYMVMAILGGFAVTKLFTASGQINIFKIILLLLGVNLISMFLYCLGVFKKQAMPSIPTSIFKLINQAKGLLKSSAPQSLESKTIISSWAKMNLSGSVGKWTFARMINAAWSSYLFGGLLALLTVLSFKQVEFIWGTTILSSDSFLSLTRWLAYLPEMVGLTPPTEEQIISSRLTQVQGALHAFNSSVSMDVNRVWAHFLIACVLLYAVLPRFVLWLHAVYKQWSVKRSFTYNTNTPYIVNLRERLTPHIERIGITDADTHKTAAFADTHLKGSQKGDLNDQSSNVVKASLEKVLPSKINGAAYEWSAMDEWPITSIFTQDFGNITNRADQKIVLSTIELTNIPLAICIKSDQVADRGAQRFFSQLLVKTDLFLLIISDTPLATDKVRWAEWVSLAEQVGISDKKLFFVDMRNSVDNQGA